MCITYGFAGMETIGENLKLAPTLPEGWKGYTFRLTYHDSVLEVSVTADKVIIRRCSGSDQTILIYGNAYSTETNIVVPLQKGVP